MKQITVKAKIENWEQVLAFINEQLELLACSPKVRIQIDIAAEELFVNIANYAYQNDIGEASVLVAVNQEPLSVSITFVDNGIPYHVFRSRNTDHLRVRFQFREVCIAGDRNRNAFMRV